MSVLQKVKVNDVDVPEGVTKYDLYKVRGTNAWPVRGERHKFYDLYTVSDKVSPIQSELHKVSPIQGA